MVMIGVNCNRHSASCTSWESSFHSVLYLRVCFHSQLQHFYNLLSWPLTTMYSFLYAMPIWFCLAHPTWMILMTPSYLYLWENLWASRYQGVTVISEVKSASLTQKSLSLFLSLSFFLLHIAAINIFHAIQWINLSECRWYDQIGITIFSNSWDYELSIYILFSPPFYRLFCH